MRIFSKGPGFVELCTDLAGHALAAAKLLAKIVSELGEVEAGTRRLKEIEHQGDEVAHFVFTEISKSYNLPFDREDIYALASRLDDVLDFTYATGERLWLYKVKRVDPRALELAGLTVRQCEELSRALEEIDRGKAVLEHCRTIKELEKSADAVVLQLIGDLFEHEKNPIEIIKLKEVYEFLEMTTDKADNAANVLESIVIKRGS